MIFIQPPTERYCLNPDCGKILIRGVRDCGQSEPKCQFEDRKSCMNEVCREASRRIMPPKHTSIQNQALDYFNLVKPKEMTDG